jgi:hypothetical protein
MGDSWEVQHWGGTSVTNSGILEDYDHDGSLNYDEYQAGTDPTNGSSALTFTPGTTPKPLSNQVVLVWQGVPGKSYALQNAETISSVWSNLQGGIAGLTPLNTYTVNTAAARGCWRIKLE